MSGAKGGSIFLFSLFRRDQPPEIKLNLKSMRIPSTMNLSYLIAPQALFVHCSIARTFLL